MYPVLFEFNGIPVYAHGFFLNLALFVCLMVVVAESRRRSWPKGEIYIISLSAFVGGMIGARVSIAFFNGWQTAPVVLDFYRLFDPRIGPGSILGAVAGAYIAGFIASRAIGKAGCVCDAFAPAMALAMFIGRFGCFLSGEDGLGTPTGLPWGVWNGSYLAHPTPIYEAAFNLVWFFALLLLSSHPRMQNGNLLKLGLAGYAIVRFWIEFVRNNRVVIWGLTGQQYACLAILLAIALYYAYQLTRTRRPGMVKNKWPA